MRRWRHTSLVLASLLWIAGLIWFTLWARRSAWLDVRPSHPVGWLTVIVVTLVICLIALLFFKKRLAVLAAVSLLLATFFTAVWIASMKADFSVEWKDPMREITAAGEKRITTNNFFVECSLGGIGLERALTSLWLRPDLEPIKQASLRLLKSTQRAENGSQTYPERSNLSPGMHKPIPKWGGFDSSWYTATDPTKQWQGQYSLVVPLWFLILLCGIFPALFLHKVLKERRRLREDRCLCWYQLVGTPPNPDGTRRCPECGRINPASKPQAASDTSGSVKISSATTDENN